LLARLHDLNGRRRIGGLEVVTGTLEVRNIGLVDAPAFRVSAELGPAAGPGAAYVRQDIPLARLRAGQSTMLIFTLTATAPPGDKFLSVDVDSLEQVAEGDEDNNLVIEKVR
jgi:subtilase family serine protease